MLYYESLLSFLSTPAITPSAYWPMVSNLLDKTGVHNGSGTNITYGSGLARNATVFNGSSSVVIAADSDDFSFTSGGGVDLPCSMSLLVYYNAAIPSGGYYVLLNKRAASTGTNMEWQLLDAQGIGLAIQFMTSNTQAIGRKIPNLTHGVWNHIVVTYTGSKNASGILIYKNAVLQAMTNENIGTNYTGMSNTAAPLTMGKFGFTSNGYLNGKISDVAIEKGVVWTQAQVNEIYNKAINGIDLI